MTEGWDEMVVVGTVLRPHGLRGHVIVKPETDFPDERFRAGSVVYMQASAGPHALTVREARWHLGRLRVVFEHVASLEDAEALGRGELRVESARLSTLPAGTYYHHQLVGCEVRTVTGDTVGKVRRVDGAGGASTLVVDGRRGDVLVPLAGHICVEIDVDGRRIAIEPPEGLLELNVTRGER
jgi:16S rRNA processing protein RimM